MRWLLAVSAAIVLLAGGACAAPAGPTRSPDSAPTLQPSPVLLASPTPEATRTAASTPAISIPPELIGTWETDLTEFYEEVCIVCGTDATVTITEDGTYKLVRGTTTVTGRLALEGERIVFLGNQRCSGSGAYEWTVEGEGLVMTSAGRDACPNRAEALDGPTYTRAS